MIVSKAPKTRLYGKSAVHIRVACAVNNKNSGEKYCIDVARKLSLSPGKYSKKYIEKVDYFSHKRYEISLTRIEKLKCDSLKKARTELKNKNEAKEGITYESNVGLLNNVPESIPIVIVDKNVNPICVFFDMEMPSFSKTSGILQIAAKYEKFEFTVYIKPSSIQKVSEEASQIHGLRVVEGKLQLHGKSVITVAISEALLAIYEFLCSFGKKCISIAHNCSFDYSRLMNAIETVYMKEHFQANVHGFCDTLPIIKNLE